VEGVEKINTVAVRGQGQRTGVPRSNLYAIEIDRVLWNN